MYPFIDKTLPPLEQSVIDRLRRAHESALLFKDYCIRRLGDLAPHLCRDGRVIMIKGLALCETIYREPLVRPMTDVDLLVPDGNLTHVREVLAANGFTRLMKYQNVWQDSVMQIDLHQDLWDSARIPARAAIAPRITLDTIPSTMIPGLHITTQAVQFAHGAYHGIKHGFSRGVWLLDLALLARSEQSSITTRISAGRCEQTARGLLAAAGLTNDTYSRAPTSIRDWLLMQALHKGEYPGMGEVALALCAPSWMQSLQYALGSILPPQSVLEEMYGHKTFPALIVARLAALARHAGKVLHPW